MLSMLTGIPVTKLMKIIFLGSLFAPRFMIPILILSIITIQKLIPGQSSQKSSGTSDSEEEKQKEELERKLKELIEKYDGSFYAPGTYSSSDPYSAKPVDPPVTSTLEDRHPLLYSAIINQFGVETNPRYRPRNNNTYCNIFVWDVSSAMGAEIPHWINPNTGEAVDYNEYQEMKRLGELNHN